MLRQKEDPMYCVLKIKIACRLAYSAVRIEDLHTEAVLRITADIAFYATFAA